jgi:adenylyltransferase/sulfurtransferase
MPAYDADRYSRQTRFAPLGPAGQERLAAARIVVVGCGALGGVVAMALARAGVGFLRLIDRDTPERSNLPRQVLFDEADVAAGLPKSVAAAGCLARINSAIAAAMDGRLGGPATTDSAHVPQARRAFRE